MEQLWTDLCWAVPHLSVVSSDVKAPKESALTSVRRQLTFLSAFNLTSKGSAQSPLVGAAELSRFR